MSSISLRLNSYNVQVDVGAIASLRSLDHASGAPRQEVAIPANTDGESVDIPVAPGRWLVEATLPSGEVLTEEVEVPPDGTVPVVFEALEPSPHEWLSWQKLVGNVPGENAVRRSFERYSLRLAPEQDLLEIIEMGYRDGLSAEPVSRRVRTDKLALPPAPAPAPADADVLSSGSSFAPELAPCRLVGSDGETRWRSILHGGESIGTALSPQMTDPLTQSHLFVEGGDARFLSAHWGLDRFLVSLPQPWTDTRTYQDLPAQVLVRFDPDAEATRIGVAVEDRGFGAIIGMMTSAALPRAVTVAHQAQHLLLGKMQNPLAAAAGGYILVAGGATDGPWMQWIDNLCDWFPHIPDGAILRGAILLRFPRDENSADEARKSFLEGFERGLPYYSAGVAWLLDGLTTFADTDPEIDRKMKLVRQVAQRIDQSQAFTVLKLDGRT